MFTFPQVCITLVIGISLSMALISCEAAHNEAAHNEAQHTAATVALDRQEQALRFVETVHGLPRTDAKTLAAVKRSLSERLSDERFLILPSEVPGLLRVVRTDGSMLYVTSDGGYLVAGPIVDIRSGEDIYPRDETRAKIILSYVDGGDQSVELGDPPGAAEQNTATTIPENVWPEFGLVPVNHLSSEQTYAQPTVATIERVALALPELVRNERITGEGAMVSVIAGAIPDDRVSVTIPSHGEEKGRITVFADPSCPNCQKFHAEVEQYSLAGYTIRYVLLPRDPSNAELMAEINQLSCLPREERASALSKLYQGEGIGGESCGSTLAEQAVDAREFYKVEGTPILFASDIAHVIPGYIPSADLIPYLDLAHQRVSEFSNHKKAL